MEDTATDYKLLYEQAIAAHKKSLELILEMVVDKYVFGLPLHRQIDKYRRLGVNVPASTASDWIMKGWQHLAPLWELLKLLVLNQKYLQADETPLKVLDRDHKNGVHQGFMWIYNAPCDKLTLFDYRKGRDQSGPKQMLLYALEKQMREEGLDWEEKTKLRQEKSVPVLLELKDWMTQQLPLVIPKSPLGQAIAYTLPRWEGLSAYALHGQIEIDNNLAENVIRPLAIGRKAFLFAGSHQAAEMTAAMYSFMATCKKNGVDEQEWLKDVFERIQSHKQKDLYQLLPNNWIKFRKPGV